MRYEDIWELYEGGDLEMLIEQLPDIDALDTIHSAMFENALDVGLSKEEISRAMQNVNYEIGRKHMLDERLADVNGMDRLHRRRQFIAGAYGILLQHVEFGHDHRTPIFPVYPQLRVAPEDLALFVLRGIIQTVKQHEAVELSLR